MKLFKFQLVIILILLGAFSCSHELETGPDETNTDNVYVLFEEYETFLKTQSPVWAVSHGHVEFDGKWPDKSLSGIREKKVRLEGFEDQLSSIKRNSLNEEEKVYVSLIEFDVADKMSSMKNMQHFFCITDQYGIHHELPSAVASHSIKTETQLSNLFKMMKAIPAQIDSTIAVLKEGVKLGFVPSRAAVKGVPEQIKILRETEYGNNPFLKPFNELWNSDEEIAESQRGSMSHEPERLLRKTINPSLEKLESFIRNEYLGACREGFGISEVPGGEKMYEHLIKHYTTTEMTAEEIFGLGKSEVARIKTKMQQIKSEIGFKGNLNEFNEHLRTDPQFFHKSPNALLSAYRDICKRIDPELASQFGKLPRLTYGVIPVPSYLEENYTTARYQSGSITEGRAGNFLANTYDLKSRPIWEMEALSLHEAVPGHHLQISLEQELENVPGFKKFLFYTVFVEGWALYGESLGKDLGMYKDLYSEYGQLTYEMWRAIRLVLDPGIHRFGWTRQEAIDYFLDNSAKTEKDVQVEVDRYIGWPGQALAYKIGELKIQELRARVQNKQGAEFDVREFHDHLLSRGSVPLNLLETMVVERYGL